MLLICDFAFDLTFMLDSKKEKNQKKNKTNIKEEKSMKKETEKKREREREQLHIGHRSACRQRSFWVTVDDTL